MPKQDRKATRKALRAYRQTISHRWDGNPKAYWSKPVASYAGVQNTEGLNAPTHIGGCCNIEEDIQERM